MLRALHLYLYEFVQSVAPPTCQWINNCCNYCTANHLENERARECGSELLAIAETKKSNSEIAQIVFDATRNATSDPFRIKPHMLSHTHADTRLEKDGREHTGKHMFTLHKQ